MTAYKQKTKNKIAYKDAPSGFITITKWEPPFVPVTNGYGFIGVLAEDFRTGDLQCHVCGKWYEQLPTHFSVKHQMTGDSYRKKFGLFASTALKSKRIRLIQSEVISRLQKEGKMNVGNRKNKNGKSYGFTKKNKEAGNRKGIKKPIEAENRHGSCDLQIMTKIIELGKKLGKTPTLTDIKDEYGGGIISIMHNRYGSYVSYCREKLKMTPNFSNYNPKYGSKKEWREHLLLLGKEALKNKRRLTVKDFLPGNEGRYVYKYFKNWADYKNKLLALK